MGQLKQLHIDCTSEECVVNQPETCYMLSEDRKPDIFDDEGLHVDMALWEITKAIAILEKYRKIAREHKPEILKHATALTDIAENE